MVTSDYRIIYFYDSVIELINIYRDDRWRDYFALLVKTGRGERGFEEKS